MNRKVAILSTSLAIDSVGAALNGVPGLEIVRFDKPTAEDLASLRACRPDAVVFDIAVALADRPFLELLTYSGALLVGCDVAAQQMYLLSGRPARLSTVDDLLVVLAKRTDQPKRGADRRSRSQAVKPDVQPTPVPDVPVDEPSDDSSSG